MLRQIWCEALDSYKSLRQSTIGDQHVMGWTSGLHLPEKNSDDKLQDSVETHFGCLGLGLVVWCLGLDFGLGLEG